MKVIGSRILGGQGVMYSNLFVHSVSQFEVKCN